MPGPLRRSFAIWCRSTRIDLDITQQALAEACGVSRSYIARIEAGLANPTLGLVDRIGDALDTAFVLSGTPPIVVDRTPPSDIVHARCSGYVQRRLIHHGFDVAREVGIVDGRTRGWIDVLAFDRRTGLLLIIEIKTSIDDIGLIERQLGRYERLAAESHAARDWRPTVIESWLLVLATADVDAAVARHRDVLALAFPVRASDMRAALEAVAPGREGRGLALIDPRSRRRDWLIPSRSDGRRSPAPYATRAAAVRSLA